MLRRDVNQKGFTLIELMIVVAIMGILVAIAVPNFNSYRQKALKQMVVSTVRNTASLEEAYYATNQAYHEFSPVTGPTVISFPGGNASIRVSPRVTISAVLQPDNSLKVTGTHPGITSAILYDTLIGVVL